MAEVEKTLSFFHPLLSHSSLHPPKRKTYSSRSHTMSMSSFPQPTNIFLLSLISFFTITSILFSILSTGNKHLSVLSSLFGTDSSSAVTTTILPSHPLVLLKNMTTEEVEFWKQNNDQTAVEEFNQPCPCQDFAFRYRRISGRVSKEKRRFLVFLISGDLFQLRNQIIEAVIISWILEAALVVPVFTKNSNFNIESEFADIFDMEHFIKTLRYDVRVVASQPYTHLTANQLKGLELPRQITPQWIRTKFRKQLDDEGVIVLGGSKSKLVGKLPTDLLKLRCKVAFNALRFSNPVREIGYKLAKRVWIEGLYAAFDIGLKSLNQTSKFNAKYQHEHLKTGLLAGDTEQQVLETARLLKGAGVPTSATIYAAGVDLKQLGAAERLKPLKTEFPNLVSMETVARVGELLPFVNSSYAMAAIDYIVALNSDVFLVSEDTYLDRTLQEQRAYTGKKSVINLRRAELMTTNNVDNRDTRDAHSAYLCCMCKRALFRLF